MTLNTILLVVLSLLVAGGLSFFQYYLQSQKQFKAEFVFGFFAFFIRFWNFTVVDQSCSYKEYFRN